MKEMSVEDQFRVSERIATREWFEVVARFEDRAITGGTSARPGHQAMLEGARRGEFGAIVAEDLKRLWREQAEQWRCIKELLDLDMCVVTASGIDSRQPNFEIIASVIETGPNSRRRSKWVASAIHGDVRRGSGFLAAVPRSSCGMKRRRQRSTGPSRRLTIKETWFSTYPRVDQALDGTSSDR
jgi:hypothetical protein